MNTYGLTPERYNQMLESYCGDEEAIREITEEWTPECCNAGYVIVAETLPGGGNATHIERIDIVDAFADDNEAARQAAKDGVPLVPIEELSGIPVDRRLTHYVDTPETRSALALFAAHAYEQARREQETARLRGDIACELSKIQGTIDRIMRRTARIPENHSDPAVLQEFFGKILALKYAAYEASIFGII